MKVVMRIPRRWQDAGREIDLGFGYTYDLPDNIASALVATGAAVRAADDAICQSVPAIRRTRDNKP